MPAPLIASLILAAVSVLALVAFVYPYLIYPALLARMRERPVLVEEASGADASQFAILFCAFNEASSAHDKVDNLRVIKGLHPEVEILIYDDGSTDGCVEIYEADPDLVRVIRGPGRRGKAHGMKQLVRATDRDFLVFTDANVQLAPDVLEQASVAFASGAGGVCGHLTYEFQSGSGTEVAGSAYWKLDEKLKELESRTGNVMGGDGSIFAVRRDLYPEYPDTVQDDFTVTMAVVFAGERLIYRPQVEAFENLVSGRGDEYRRKVRIAARAYHTHTQMRSGIRSMSGFDRWKYISHKVLRWYGALFLVTAALAAIVAVALVSPLLLASVVLGGGVVVALALWMVPRTRVAIDIIVAVFATFHGVLLGLRGVTFATWTPPKSR